MIDLVKLIRTDRGLSIDETLIREEVKRIIELEAEIANVSTLDSLDFFGTKAHPFFFFVAQCFFTASYRKIICANDLSESLRVPDGSSCCVKQPLRRLDRQVSLFVIPPACSSVCFCFPFPNDCRIFQGHHHPKSDIYRAETSRDSGGAR